MNWSEDSNYNQIELQIELLTDQHKDLMGWAINAKATQSVQSLMMAKKHNEMQVYQSRDVDDTSYKVTLYVTGEEGAKTGASTATIQPADAIESQLLQILANARLAMNAAYPLAEKPDQEYPNVESSCPEISANIVESHQSMVKRIEAHVASLTNVQVNSAELYSNVHYHGLKTSTGIKAQKTTTDVYFEVAMERVPGPNLQEVLKYWHFVGMGDANLEERLDAVAEETQLTTGALMPPARTSATILVDSYAISKFVTAITTQLSGEAEYAQGPHLKPNDQLTISDRDEQSDTLTITIDPTLAQMAKSTAYTEEGLVAQKADVIVNNEVKHQLLNTRFAHILGKEPNGIYGNLVVTEGSATRESLLESKEEVIEILDFSSLLVNPTSLTWSSEIKLGRLYQQGKPVKTLKGGIVSGNIRESLAGFKFSRDLTRRNTAGGYFEPAGGYLGPEHMLMWKGISIAGESEQEAE
ncbi:hypothetical protein KO489_12210 [Reinekea forsetii]|nr:hypothetical protein [Reinekea forsetii]